MLAPFAIIITIVLDAIVVTVLLVRLAEEALVTLVLVLV